MKKTRSFIAILLCLVTGPLSAFADHYPVDTRIDIKHYQFNLTVSDWSNEINMTTVVTVIFKEAGVKQIRLDLINKSDNGKGMVVDGITSSNKQMSYTHLNNALTINLDQSPSAGSEMSFTIGYHGAPADGFRIGPTKYGDRSFFSDNWPNKARNWLAVIDHPSDKASSELIVKAPSKYKVVSNGLLMEESVLNDSTTLTHWKQSVPIASWLYTIGIAQFAVQYLEPFEGKQIQTWVYAKDRNAGFADFSSPSKEALTFFSDYVGPFAYEKLANIESPVVQGGMEAASAIGYGEKMIKGERTKGVRNIIVHEIAHQWFGNAVTEKNWDDAWLSEGFATCFTKLFIEHQYGKEEFQAEWQKSKDMFKRFYQKDSTYAIVADRTAEKQEVTNVVTYQKGACILLMLRDMIGEDAFKKGIRSYYARYMNLNATTKDFKTEMEKASGLDLTKFFDQWLHRGGMIRVASEWTYDQAKKQLVLTIHQVQKPGELYDFPLEVSMTTAGNNTPVIKKLHITKQTEQFRFPMASEPTRVELDPRKVLLGEFETKKLPN
ncbi:MAG TPA: M1 family metallopeptidase [Chitinophagaceae bacterium]|nr:M1 family metallopeptidase [Chitinophagaceae bacterium]